MGLGSSLICQRGLRVRDVNETVFGMANGFTNVCGIAPTALVFVDDARFHVVRNPILELENGAHAS